MAINMSMSSCDAATMSFMLADIFDVCCLALKASLSDFAWHASSYIVADVHVKLTNPVHVQNLKHIPLDCETVAETSDTAFGDGTGIVVVAETSTGCLLGASGIGERGVQAEQIANTAADELIEAIYSGACVDQW